MQAIGRRLFLAVTSGQNVANVAPILEAGSADRGDAVVWLSSPFAAQRGWTTGPSDVLRQRGFAVLPERELPDAPADAAAALRALLNETATSAFEPVLIANGGTKPTSLALNAHIEARRPLALIYQQERPAEWWDMPEGIAGARHIRKFSQSRLTLSEVLACSGHVIAHEPGADAQRFWPDETDLGRDGYGLDFEATARAHDDAMHRQSLLAEAHENADTVITLDQAVAAEASALKGFLVTLFQAVNAIPEVPHRDDLAGLLRLSEPHMERLRPVFTTAQRAAAAVRKAGLGLAGGVDDPLGPRLERAVARRVRTLLAEKDGHLPVNEAWLNVRIAHRSAPHTVVQELDIALVLANGILLALECKTHVADKLRKDLDARALNLQRAGSSPARLMLCFPLYTPFLDRAWFSLQHRIRREYGGAGEGYLPFTLPGQPEVYDWNSADGQTERVAAHTFEAHLGKLLAPYVSRAD